MVYEHKGIKYLLDKSVIDLLDQIIVMATLLDYRIFQYGTNFSFYTKETTVNCSFGLKLTKNETTLLIKEARKDDKIVKGGYYLSIDEPLKILLELL